MLPRHYEPIVAIATASGRGAVGIVRVSAADLREFTLALLGRLPVPRQATYLPFTDAAGSPIDHGLAIWFPGPHSYTGEDVLELQAHGGMVVLQLLLSRCLEVAALPASVASADPPHRAPGPVLDRLRLAGPGEFTERAFLNGKLDLAQAEAVGDLIDASTEAAARSAVRSLTGAFSAEVDGLRDRLIELRLWVEATLDFPEEEIDVVERAGVGDRLEALAGQVDSVLARAAQGSLLREGIRVVIAGQPNVGKSSLLNALAGAEVAIVTPVAGTTRDKVTATIQIEGVPVHVIDTAGLRVATDEVERIGISRSWEAVDAADAVVFLRDLTRLGEPDHDAGDALIAQRLPVAAVVAGRVLQVFNKADAPEAGAVPAGGLAISALTGAGIDRLRRRLLELAGWQSRPDGVFIARARHLDALRRTLAHLQVARQLVAAAPALFDVLAEELRLAHDALGEITGRLTADDLLGQIFGRFCIGK